MSNQTMQHELCFVQLVNHGIPVELLEKVKRVSSECFKKEREENFNKSTALKLLDDVEKNKSNGSKVENVDWEDVFLLTDYNEWPSDIPQFRFKLLL